MLYLKGIKALISRTLDLTCPHCARHSPQLSSKVKKNRAMVCPYCGTLFLPSECQRLG